MPKKPSPRNNEDFSIKPKPLEKINFKQRKSNKKQMKSKKSKLKNVTIKNKNKK